MIAQVCPSEDAGAPPRRRRYRTTGYDAVVLGVLDEGRLAAVRGYASDAVGCALDRITEVSRFEDGNRHAVYKVSYLDAEEAITHVVVRVAFGGDPSECAQAAREGRALEKFGGLAAPVLYDFRSTSAWFETPAMCMQFVPGHQQELSSARPAAIEQLGSVVAEVHGQPADDLVEALGEAGDIASYAEDRVRSILSGLPWVRGPLPAEVQVRLRRAADELERSWGTWRDAESFRTGEGLAPLHGDVALGNVLWGPNPVLIDWEYTRLGDPADEIAYLFDQNGLDAAQREAFWRGYRASASSDMRLDHVVDRVEWWERLTLLGSSLWWVERWVRRTEADAAGRDDPEVHREPAYYADHVFRRLDRLEPLLGGPP